MGLWKRTRKIEDALDSLKRKTAWFEQKIGFNDNDIRAIEGRLNAVRSRRGVLFSGVPYDSLEEAIEALFCEVNRLVEYVNAEKELAERKRLLAETEPAQGFVLCDKDGVIAKSNSEKYGVGIAVVINPDGGLRHGDFVCVHESNVIATKA